MKKRGELECLATYVLAHNHKSVHASELSTHDADLLGGDVVNIDEKSLVVLAQGFLEGGPLVGLSLSLGKLGGHSKKEARSDIFDTKVRA